MIAFLRGILADRQPHRVLIDVGGVGYEVQIPLSCYDQLPASGAEVKLLTHFVVREQEQTLYGFMKDSERDLFSLLIGRVSGVGPKIALAVLSGMGIDEFKAAVVAGDITACQALME